MTALSDDGEYKMVIVVRTDLKMGKGKAAAQVTVTEKHIHVVNSRVTVMQISSKALIEKKIYRIHIKKFR